MMEYITSPTAAEENAAARMREFGFADAEITGGSADAGIDVQSRRAIAQVKWQGAVTSRPDLQRLYGARGAVDNRALLFFSASGYSGHAVEYADQCGISLFTYDPLGKVSAVNSSAEDYISIAQDRRSALMRTVQISQPKRPLAPRGSAGSSVPLTLGGNPRSAEAQRKLEARRSQEQAALKKKQDEDAEGCLRVGCGTTLVVGFGIGLFVAGRRLLDANDAGAVGWALAIIFVCAALIFSGVRLIRPKK